jgi:glycosyltransferase involved in cell wall biosynthesis
MPAEPLISAVIPVYNGAALLDQSIGSMAAQSYRNLEIVVVDDGSTDATPELLRDWVRRDSRIRLIPADHGGPEHARNVGVAAAHGAYIAHLDQDDIAAPSRLATQYQWLQAHGLDVVGSCTWVFGDARYLRWVPQRGEDIRREYVFRLAMIHSTILISAAVAKAHPFRQDLSCGGEELLMRLALRYRVGNVPHALVKYRRHADQRYRRVLEKWRRDSSEARRNYFFAMFPEATDADHAALMRVADGVTFADDAEKLRAASWLERLSGTTDPALKRLMDARWAVACGTPLTS